MTGFLRDALISFCPETARRALRPESTHRVQLCATWTGFIQFMGFSLLLWLRYKNFLMARSQQWAPYLGGSERIQVTAFIIATLEFFIYPSSLLLLYFALEGLARFMAGLVSSQVVPSLPVFLGYRLKERLEQRRQAERLASLPPDTVEFLREGRVRIASARVRPHWNASITLGIRGMLYEIEGKEPGLSGRPFVYVLKPVAPGRALRGYENYDLDTAEILNEERVEPAPVPVTELRAERGPVEN